MLCTESSIRHLIRYRHMRISKYCRLRSLMFVIYILYFDGRVKNGPSKFTDDPKFGGKVESKEGSDQIQEGQDCHCMGNKILGNMRYWVRVEVTERGAP